MAILNLPEGTHTIKWTLAGYNDLTAQIRISSTGAVTCISVYSGSCGGYSVPRVSISGSTVTGYMKSSTSTPTPTPSPTPSPTPTSSPSPTPTPGKVYVEKLSNDYSIKTLPFLIQYSSKENCDYLYAPEGSPSSSGAYAEYNITIPKSDTYKIVGKVHASTYSSNSFYLQVDSKLRNTWDMKISGNATWRDVSARGNGTELSPEFPIYKVYLTQGTHRIKIMHRESKTRLFKFVVTNDMSYLTGSPTPTPSPTPSPTPTITPSPTPGNSYTSWLNNKGGKPGLKNNLSALLEIVDGYLGFKNLGFTVSLGNVLQTVDGYLGF